MLTDKDQLDFDFELSDEEVRQEYDAQEFRHYEVRADMAAHSIASEIKNWGDLPSLNAKLADYGFEILELSRTN